MMLTNCCDQFASGTVHIYELARHDQLRQYIIRDTPYMYLSICMQWMGCIQQLCVSATGKWLALHGATLLWGWR